ncbi:MAG: outer membrane beta-barrel protein [Bacteroidia bacterium]
MNLLRNRNKEFEKKLKERLGDAEYKPSEPVWEKIASEISRDELEVGVAEKADHFLPKVNPKIWENIESKITVSGKLGYRKYLWIPLVLLFIGSSGYFGFQYFKNNVQGEKNIASGSSIPELKNENSKPSKGESETVEHRNEKLIPEKIIPVEKVAETLSIKSGEIKVNKKAGRSPAFKNNSAKVPPVIFSGNNLTVAKNVEPKNNIVRQNPETVKTESENPNPVAKVDSVITTKSVPPFAKKDSSLVKPAESIAKADTLTNVNPGNFKKKSGEELTRFSISALTGIHECYNILLAPSSSNLNLKDNISLRKQIELPSSDWNGAFFLNYELNKKWRISSGIMVSNFSQQFNFDTLTPNSTHAAITEHGVKMANQNDSITSGNSNSYRIKYTWTEIPLLITYTFFQKKKFDFEITTGVSYAFISGVDAAYVSYDNVGVLILTDKDAFPGIKNNFFFHFYPSVSYHISEKISIGVVPTFKMSITSITGNDNWVQQYPYFIGISGTLRKKF